MSDHVYEIDCMRHMATLDDGCMDLAICDVPYGINVGNMAFLTEQKKTVLQKNGTRLTAQKRTPYKLKDWDTTTPGQDYFDELRRVSKNQIIFGIDYMNWEGVGPGRIVWNKGVPEALSFKGQEVAYQSFSDEIIDLDLLWSGFRQAKSLSEPMVQQGNKKLNEKRIHPCHKPILLYAKLLQMFAKPGGKIYDTHMGSQSSRIASYILGFEYWGCEIDPDYFETGCKRFSEHLLQHKMF